jgi:hypothetical protein
MDEHRQIWVNHLGRITNEIICYINQKDANTEYEMGMAGRNRLEIKKRVEVN